MFGVGRGLDLSERASWKKQTLNSEENVGTGVADGTKDETPRLSNHVILLRALSHGFSIVAYSRQPGARDYVSLILVLSLISCAVLGNLFKLSLDYDEDETSPYSYKSYV